MYFAIRTQHPSISASDTYINTKSSAWSHPVSNVHWGMSNNPPLGPPYISCQTHSHNPCDPDDTHKRKHLNNTLLPPHNGDAFETCSFFRRTRHSNTERHLCDDFVIKQVSFGWWNFSSTRKIKAQLIARRRF